MWILLNLYLIPVSTALAVTSSHSFVVWINAMAAFLNLFIITISLVNVKKLV
jgi:hypothetical protein